MKLSEIKKIYVADYNGFFKIGVSKNVQKRIKQLSCGCPTINVIYQSDYLLNSFEIEVMLHNLYKDKNIGGEWFSQINIKKIKEIVEKYGNVANYEKHKEKDETEFSNELESILNKIFVNSYFKEDNRIMSVEELKYENEEIYKFSIAISGVDISNIYSDLIYNIIFGKNTKQLIAEYKANEFESFRKYLTPEQNSIIKKYSCIIGDMINSYWTFEEIKDCMEKI